MQKTVYVESVGSEVYVSRRKGTRNLRLSIRSDGRIRLTIPYGVSEKYAQKFLEDKAAWIQKHTKPSEYLFHEMHIGKGHQLVFNTYNGNTVKSRIKQNEIHIFYPQSLSIESPAIQQKAMQACEKALKKEAATLLPIRLEDLAAKHNISYRNVKVKKLKSRWGSCDNRKNIILNIYLMQLSWNLIDYVIVHELAHIKHQHHQNEFWEYMETLMPDYLERRKELKTHPTNIFATNF